MRKLFLFLMFTGMFFASCTNDDDDVVSKIKFAQQTIETEFETGSYSVVVTSPQSWEAFSKNDWIEIDSKQGAAGRTELSFTLSRNVEQEKRMGTIVVTNSEYNLVAELYITQKAFVPQVTIEPTALMFSAKKEEQNVKVTANFSHSATSNVDWLRITQNSEGYTISVPEYGETAPRTAEITIKNGKYAISEVINVTQVAFEPSEIVIEPESLNFSVEGGEQSVKITTNYDYQVSEGADWLYWNWADGGITVVTYASDEIEERTADIVVSNTQYGISKTIKVMQGAFQPSELVIEPELLEFSAHGGKQDIEITANFEYEATVSVNWLSLSRTDNGYVVSVSSNYNTSSRSTDIIIRSKNTDYNISKSVTITQEAFVPEFEIGLNELGFEAYGGTQLIPIISNFTYTVSENYSWITCRNTNEGISVTVDPSNVSEERTAQIKIYHSSYGISEVVNIKQSQQDPNKIIVYTSSDRIVVNPNQSGFDKNIILNTYDYSKNYGAIVFDGQITDIKSKTFLDCTTLKTITIPKSVTQIGHYVFQNCSALTSVDIPDSVTSIGTYAFYNCSSLTSVTIPDSVTEIGMEAFYNCSSLTSITIPDSVTSIGRHAFYNCSSLTSVTIPNSVTSIYICTFYNCNSLTSVTIPNSVTSIGEEAFYDCTSLTSVTIPDSITSIGRYAFFNCSSLTSVYCKPAAPPSGGYVMFGGNASGRKIYVPRNSVSAYKTATYWKNLADEIVGYDF